MPLLVLYYFASLMLLAVRLETVRSPGALPVCDACEYDLSGLAKDAECPECGGQIRRSDRPPATVVRIKAGRTLFLFAAGAAWLSAWLGHRAIASGMLFRSMVRQGFSPHAASVWIFNNADSADIFETPLTAFLGAVALVCFLVTPWFSLLPRLADAWKAGLLALALGVLTVCLAYIAT